MSELKAIYIDPKFLYRDSSTSDGSQIKYNYNRKWYKIDRNGGEAESESLASLILECSSLQQNQYVHYDKVLINNDLGCVSDDFRTDIENEEFVTFYRLYKNINGRDLTSITSKMDYDDAIQYVISFIYDLTGLDITTYLANIFYLDEIILNTDRHFNNLGLIMYNNNFSPAPIFDNGNALLTGYNYDTTPTGIESCIKNVFAKTFSPKYSLNSNYLKESRTLIINKKKLLTKLSNYPDSPQKQVLLFQINRLL